MHLSLASLVPHRRAQTQHWMRSRSQPLRGCDSEDDIKASFSRLSEVLRSLTARGVDVALHMAWAVSHRVERRGDVYWLAAAYLAHGTQASPAVIRVASSELLRAAGGWRVKQRWQHGGRSCLVQGACIPRASAAAMDAITTAALDLGMLAAPGVSRHAGMTFPVEVTNRKTRCPCPAHTRGDTNPSLILNATTAVCAVSRHVFALDRTAGTITQLLTGGQRKPVDVDIEAILALAKRRLKATPQAAETAPLTPRRPWVAARPQALVGDVVGANLKARLVPDGVATHRALGASARSLAAKMVWADTYLGGPASLARAERGEAGARLRAEASLPPTPQVECPDRLYALDSGAVRVHMAPGTETEKPRFERVEVKFRGQRRICFDLDHLASVETDCAETAAFTASTALDVMARHYPSCPVAVVATSRTGLQVVVEMGAVVEAYWTRQTRAAATRAGGELLALLGRGGSLDTSALAPGRLARLPGWRVGRDLKPVRSRLWFVTLNGIAHGVGASLAFSRLAA